MRRESGARGPAEGARSGCSAVMTATSARAGDRGVARFGVIDVSTTDARNRLLDASV